MKRLLLIAIALNFISGCSRVGDFERPPKRQEFIDNGVETCSLRRLDNQVFGVDMSGYDIKVKFLGFVGSRNSTFGVFFHDAIRIQNQRETRRVILMKNGCKYVGHYVVSADPLRVSGADILFDAPAEYGNVIHFPSGSPPKTIWIDGEINAFSK